MQNRYKNFSQLILNISRQIQKIKNIEMQKLGFKGSQVEVLFTLYQKSGATSTELATECGEDKAAISRTVKELALRNLVCEEDNPAQKYRKKILLTKEGEEVGKHITDKISSFVEIGSAGVSDKDREKLYCVLKKITTNLEGFCN